MDTLKFQKRQEQRGLKARGRGRPEAEDPKASLRTLRLAGGDEEKLTAIMNLRQQNISSVLRALINEEFARVSRRTSERAELTGISAYIRGRILIALNESPASLDLLCLRLRQYEDARGDHGYSRVGARTRVKAVCEEMERRGEIYKHQKSPQDPVLYRAKDS